MKESQDILERRTGFSLVEILAAMVIGTMILIAVFKVYDKAKSTAAAVTRNLDSFRRPYEVLQLIAEDYDKIISTNSNMNLIILDRNINDYTAALLVFTSKYKDTANKEKTYKEIIWQCNIDPESDANDLVLYRLYNGILPEDKLLDKDREEYEKNVYVPICSGVTYFSVKVYSGKEREKEFWADGIPFGITITISFAKPFKNDEGKYEVPESEKYSRTIAIDKSRNIKFDISEEELSGDETIKTTMNVIEKNTSAGNEKK